MKKLTDRQQEILDFIVEEIQRQGYPPTLREISTQFGISSTQGVRLHIDALEKKGNIVRDAGARRISVSSEILDLTNSADIVSIPVLGEVAAGQPSSRSASSPPSPQRQRHSAATGTPPLPKASVQPAALFR